MKALIVENEPVARLLLEKQTRSFGFDVTTCKNGECALVAYTHTFYPLLVLDLGLPGMYGLDLCRQIRGMSGGDRSVILVITERHDPEYLQAIIQAGADDYLTKPLSTELLKMRLTVHKRAMEQLRFQAQLLDNVRESVIVTDLEGRVIYWSKGAEALYGYPVSEVIGKVVSTSIGPFEEAEGQERIRQVLETGSWSGQYVQQRKNGTLFLSDTVMSLMSDQNGQPCGLISIDRDITERRQMEETLRYSEEQYRILVESASDNIFMLNANGDFLSINQEAAKNFGKTSEGIIGKNLRDFLPKDVVVSQLKMLKEVFLSGETSRLPDSLTSTPHGDKWLSTTFTPIKDRRGHVVYVIGIARDITDRKRAEEQLRFQAQLLNSVREATVATDLEGHIIYWGNGAEELYGYSAEEMTGKSIALIVASQNKETEHARMRQVHKTGKWSGQYMKRRKDGSLFWADTTISLVTNQYGQPCGFIGIDRDIADRYSMTKHQGSSNVSDTQFGEEGGSSSAKHEQEDAELQQKLENFERKIITETLEQNHWYRGKTAEKLGLTLKTLHKKMKKYQLV